MPVVEFIDVISKRSLRGVRSVVDDMLPTQLAVSGVNHIFKLGAQNYETAKRLYPPMHRPKPGFAARAGGLGL